MITLFYFILFFIAIGLCDNVMLCRLFEHVSVPTTHTVHISMSSSSTAANISYVTEVTVDGEALPSELHLSPEAGDGGLGALKIGELVGDDDDPPSPPTKSLAYTHVPRTPPAARVRRVSPSFLSRAFTFIRIPITSPPHTWSYTHLI